MHRLTTAYLNDLRDLEQKQQPVYNKAKIRYLSFLKYAWLQKHLKRNRFLSLTNVYLIWHFREIFDQAVPLNLDHFHSPLFSLSYNMNLYDSDKNSSNITL